jgi:uncharacterized protein
MTHDSALHPHLETAAATPPATPVNALPWFAGALSIMLIGQVARLYQVDVAAWLALDYGWRIAAVGLLAVSPAMRRIAFPKKRPAVYWALALFAILMVVIVDRTATAILTSPTRPWDPVFWVRSIVAPPKISGVAYLVDISFGLALVAYSEELLFRRVAFHVLGRYVGNGALLTLTSAVLFGLAHWWTGIPHIIATVCMGAIAMAMYKHMRPAIWPLVIAHYICDVIAFR